MRIHSLDSGSSLPGLGAHLEDFLIDAWLMGGIPGQPDPDTPEEPGSPDLPVEPGEPTLPDQPPPAPIAGRPFN